MSHESSHESSPKPSPKPPSGSSHEAPSGSSHKPSPKVPSVENAGNPREESPEVDDIDRFEQEADRSGDEAGPAPDDDLDLEAPEADAAEQHTEVVQRHDEPDSAHPADRRGEADPADTAEQRRVVELDEDDYR